MSAGTRFLTFRLPAFLYMALIFYLSSGPVTLPFVKQIPDYYLHSLGYSALYVLVFWALHEGLRPSGKYGGYWLPLLVTVFYGASDEYHQGFVPTRDASYGDLLADGVGGMIGIAWVALADRLIRLIPRLRPGRSH